MATFHLIRHAQPDSPSQILNGRRPGVGLHPQALAALHPLAAHLAASRPHQLYCSPLERTRKTAELLAHELGLGVQEAPELIELDFGQWTGQDFGQLDRDPVWRRFHTFRSGTRIPQGEMMVSVQARAVEFLFGLRDRFPEQVLGLVTHGDVIRAVLVFLLGMPLDLIHRIQIDMASVSTVELDSDMPRLVEMNWRAESR